MTMYDEIQKIIAPNTLSSFDYLKLNDLLKTYSEKEIINAYKRVGYKPVNYISKMLTPISNTPEWFNKEIDNEPIDEESQKTFDDFNSFLEEFRK